MDEKHWSDTFAMIKLNIFITKTAPKVRYIIVLIATRIIPGMFWCVECQI